VAPLDTAKLTNFKDLAPQLQAPDFNTVEGKHYGLSFMWGANVLIYNKDKITTAQLPFKLQTLKASQKEPKVVVNAAGDADFKKVVAVLDEARKIGISKVGISTEKK